MSRENDSWQSHRARRFLTAGPIVKDRQLPPTNPSPDAGGPCPLSCISRRRFVLTGSAGAATLLLGDLFAGRVRAEDAAIPVQVIRFPRQLVCKLSQLETDQPIAFEYPKGNPHTGAILVKLGRRAGGGIGPDDDVVAYSTTCTHMGGELDYNADHKLAGPCGEHLTSFDLTRHGMVVAGHATATLPQLILELDGDTLFATGIIGLLYGYHTNPARSEKANS